MAELALVLFAVAFVLILLGYPVAFTLAGTSVLFGMWAFGGDAFFYLYILRVYGTLDQFILMAVPLFVFMGVMLERSGIAEKLLGTMADLFGKVRGGLAISVILVGALLAASTGIVGATVVTMGLLSLPVMLKRGYRAELATGTIASSGTLGQIIPPSVVLVLLGSVLNVSIGKLFVGAILPGLLLVGAYIAYVLLVAFWRPEVAPAVADHQRMRLNPSRLFSAFVLPLLLVVAVLGSIFLGWASPTEAAAIGAMGAVLLTASQGRLNWKVIQEVATTTTHLTAMVFMILLGATAFGLVFRGMEGDRYLIGLVQDAGLSQQVFLALVMLVVFICGFFIDFIEIVFIIVPVVAPIFTALGVDLVWLGILLSLNLQTSFLTPPFGFSLFYLKGVAPPGVTTAHLYRGIIPFVLIQLAVLLLVVLFPGLVTWLPQVLAGQ